MNTQPIKKYYIGMLVLFAATIILFIYVASLSSGYKQDRKTNQTASKIADDLNQYIESKNKMPDELSDATKEDIPSAITYKKSTDTYKFCVTYKTASEPGVGTDPTSLLFGTIYGGMYNYSDYSDSSDYKPSGLYINTFSWEKGEQCTTVEPYMSTNKINYPQNYETESDTEDNSEEEYDYDTSSLDYLCEETYEYYDTYKEYCVDGKYKVPSYDSSSEL